MLNADAESPTRVPGRVLLEGKVMEAEEVEMFTRAVMAELAGSYEPTGLPLVMAVLNWFVAPT